MSTGYFLYDFICCLIIDQKEYANSLHHLLTLAGLYIGVFKLEVAALPPVHFPIDTALMCRNLNIFDFPRLFTFALALVAPGTNNPTYRGQPRFCNQVFETVD